MAACTACDRVDATRGGSALISTGGAGCTGGGASFAACAGCGATIASAGAGADSLGAGADWVAGISACVAAAGGWAGGVASAVAGALAVTPFGSISTRHSAYAPAAIAATATQATNAIFTAGRDGASA
ncbi:MAG TPA: hypothetical protein VLG08_09385 [Casimicrobiaceae bacterium]|nr:hypothetical protein [Casimicrobiaceae bacterium]